MSKEAICSMDSDSIANSVAIIGMAGRFPGANDISELWDVLKNGRETIRHFTEEEISRKDFDADYVLSQDNYVRARGVLEHVDLFDADFFGFTPREASHTDPQQRIWLELAYEALETAGYAIPDYTGVIGVYTGYLNSTYLLYNLLKTRDNIENYVRTRNAGDFATMLSNTNSYIATRTAYKLDLKGPAVNVQTACSTSLVSIVMAVQNLLQLESDICIAGGINVAVPQTTGYYYQEGAIHSKDGHCRPFDAAASGTVFGSGAGAVVLKRLEEAMSDNDNILAIIRGASMNNDGANKVGFTAPSVTGQAECIALAQSLADVDPTTISYIEAHGTATPMGDPVEIAGLTKAFGECKGKREFCGIGSIKSNIGHLDSAAGVAGLIKTVLALQHRQIPPTVHFRKANPNIRFKGTPFYVVDQLTDWHANGNPLRAGISSFGVGGTNAHMILEEAPPSGNSGPARAHQLLLLSAKSKKSLKMMADNLVDAVTNTADINIADAAWTLHARRPHYPERMFLVCDNSRESALASLREQRSPLCGTNHAEPTAPTLAFGFPGQGSHYHGMASQLADHEPVFRDVLAECCRLANVHIDGDLSDIFKRTMTIDAYRTRMSHNGIAQLAIFSIDYALARLWLSWGFTPSYLLGHSLGEWVAASIAGILTLEQAIEAVWHRGRLMHSVSGDGGAITVFANVKDLAPYLHNDNYVAAENAPELTLVSGKQEAIQSLKSRLDEAEIRNKVLDITVAVHSPALDEIIGPFAEILQRLDFRPPSIPIISTATGEALSNEQATDPKYWASQMRKPVQFKSAIQALLKASASPVSLIETGPGNALSALCQMQGSTAAPDLAVASLGSQLKHNEHKQILAAVGTIWASGVNVDAKKFYSHESRQATILPGYAFDRKRFWIDPPARTAPASGAGSRSRKSISESTSAAATTDNTGSGSKRLPRDKVTLLTEIWSDILGISSIETTDSFRQLGGDSLDAVRLMDRIRKETGNALPLNALETAPNIEEMAKLIALEEDATPDAPQESEKSCCLVPVKSASADSQRPIFFVPHGGGGDVHWGYVNFAAGFDADQAIWGFEYPKDTRFSSFSEMAGYYVEILKTKQPVGPYFLGGYCYGGILAYEMGVQLRRQNEEIGFMALIEAAPSNRGYGSISFSRQFVTGAISNLPHAMKGFATLTTDEKKERLVQRFQKMRDNTQSRIAALLGANTGNIWGGEVEVEEFLFADTSPEVAELWRHNLELLKNYVSPDSDIPLDVFRTQHQAIFSAHDPAFGWKTLTDNRVSCHTVPGDHLSVVNPPHSTETGRLICSRLKDAEKG